jgi:hypothetical protein
MLAGMRLRRNITPLVCRFMESRALVTGKGISKNQTYQKFELQDKWWVSKGSMVLRFALPALNDTSTQLELPAPSGVKVKAETDTEGLVSKSYSPISLPSASGYYDLLVKEYAAPEGGVVPLYFELFSVSGTN